MDASLILLGLKSRYFWHLLPPKQQALKLMHWRILLGLGLAEETPSPAQNVRRTGCSNEKNHQHKIWRSSIAMSDDPYPYPAPLRQQQWVTSFRSWEIPISSESHPFLEAWNPTKRWLFPIALLQQKTYFKWTSTPCRQEATSLRETNWALVLSGRSQQSGEVEWLVTLWFFKNLRVWPVKKDS